MLKKTPLKTLTQNRWHQKIPFFYGWIMLPIAILSMVATGPGQTFVISVFNPFWRDSLGLTHQQLTGAYMLGTLTAAIPQPYIGKLMDRWGVRRLMAVMITLFGLACLFTSQVQNIFMLFLAFVCLRMFGQGALSLLANNILSMWFRERLGLVSALMNVGLAAFNGIIPAAVLWLVHHYGWRWTYALLGITVWLMIAPILAFLFRNKPEDIGQTLDGITVASLIPNSLTTALAATATATTATATTATATTATAATATAATATAATAETTPFTLAMALRTRSFWIMLLATALWGMIATAIFFNIIPLFTAQGLSEQAAAATFATLSTAIIITQLLTGFLADRVPIHWLIALGLSCVIASVFCLIQLDSLWIGHLYAIFMGMGQALFGVAANTLWARYYGRAHLGSIRSIVWTAAVVGSSVGPFLMGTAYDRFGSYQLPLTFFIALLLPITIAALWATPPQIPAQSL